MNEENFVTKEEMLKYVNNMTKLLDTIISNQQLIYKFCEKLARNERSTRNGKKL